MGINPTSCRYKNMKKSKENLEDVLSFLHNMLSFNVPNFAKRSSGPYQNKML